MVNTMDDATLDLNGRLAAVEAQRNAALAQAAIFAGQIAVLKRTVGTLTAENEELKKTKE